MEIAKGQALVEFNESSPGVKESLVPFLLSNNTFKVLSPQFRAITRIIPVSEGCLSALELQDSRENLFPIRTIFLGINHMGSI